MKKHRLKIHCINNILNKKLKIYNKNNLKLKIYNKNNLKLKVSIFFIIITPSRKTIHHIHRLFMKNSKKLKNNSKKYILNVKLIYKIKIKNKRKSQHMIMNKN